MGDQFPSDPLSTSIQGRRYDASGNALGSDFQVNTYTFDEQRLPSVAVDANGDFVVVWWSFGSAGSDTSLYSVQGQRYDASGTALGSEFQVNTYTTGFQLFPSVGVDADGDFVVVWHSEGSAGSDTEPWSIQGQRYDACGNALGSEFQVNTYTTHSQGKPSVAVEPYGDFVVVWQSYGSAGSDTSDYSIQGQRYSSGLVREIYDGEGAGWAYFPGILARSEGDPPVGDPPDVDAAYDYAGDSFDYFFRGFGRRSLDDQCAPLVCPVPERSEHFRLSHLGHPRRSEQGSGHGYGSRDEPARGCRSEGSSGARPRVAAAS
jgi:hypothetical protein